MFAPSPLEWFLPKWAAMWVISWRSLVAEIVSGQSAQTTTSEEKGETRCRFKPTANWPAQSVYAPNGQMGPQWYNLKTISPPKTKQTNKKLLPWRVVVLSVEHSSSFHADDQPWRDDVKPTVFHWIAASSFFCLEPNQGGGGDRDCFCAVRNCSCTLVFPRCSNYKFLSRHCITAMRGTRDALADCRHRSIFVCLWLQSVR